MRKEGIVDFDKGNQKTKWIQREGKNSTGIESRKKKTEETDKNRFLNSKMKEKREVKKKKLSSVKMLSA